MVKSFNLNQIICFISITFLVGCVTTPPLNTRSGRLEVTIYGITKKEFFDAVVQAAAMDGAEIKQTSEYCMTFAKKDKSFTAAMLYGSRYDITPERRGTLTVVEVPGGIRVFATETIVTNPGSAFERVTTVNNPHALQADLEKMKIEAEKRYGSGAFGSSAEFPFIREIK